MRKGRSKLEASWRAAQSGSAMARRTLAGVARTAGPCGSWSSALKRVRGAACRATPWQAHRQPSFLILRTMVSTIAASTVVLNFRANRWCLLASTSSW